jgi:hypothetical protein
MHFANVKGAYSFEVNRKANKTKSRTPWSGSTGSRSTRFAPPTASASRGERKSDGHHADLEKGGRVLAARSSY